MIGVFILAGLAAVLAAVMFAGSMFVRDRVAVNALRVGAAILAFAAVVLVWLPA